jgi:hypothetical protein
MQQSPPTVLCLESTYSRFAASRQISHSGIYKVVTATTPASALAAFRAIQRINAAVLECGMAPEEAIRIAAEINAIRLGVPKLILAPPPRILPPESLNLVYIESVLALSEKLQLLIARSHAALKAEMQRSAELQAECRLRFEQAKRLREQAREMRKRPPRDDYWR